MQFLKRLYKRKIGFCSKLLSLLLFNFLLFCFCYTAFAQNCPSNIDFESGTFSGWTCYTGTTAAVGGQNVISLASSGGPVFGHHTMYSSNTGERDPYGGFPVTCPNGSRYSVKLGSTQAGGEAEGIAYEFTIPANANSYFLTYNYAVVFQSPNHQPYEQPRMEIEVTNVTDNSPISCASFSFIAVGTSLPGFLSSTASDTITVLYKDWSAVSVDLSGNAGKTIRLLFKTADCTFRRHFGYAYIDVNSECSGNFTGATYCPDDTLISVIAPYGYRSYAWYDSALTRLLGTQQILTLAPPPPSGTTIAVKVEPYDGYGCPQTLFTKLRDSLTVTANAGIDTLSCNKAAVSIGTNPKQGLSYAWAPPSGLSNAAIANPVASPDTTTTYVVTTANSGGGCRTTDTVVVKASVIDSSLQVLGKLAFCADYGDSAVLLVNPTANIRWYGNELAISQATRARYRVRRTGTYYAQLQNADGCRISTRKQAILIDTAKAGIRYPMEYALSNVPLPLQARRIGETALWKPALYLSASSGFTPTFKGTTDQQYTIEITSAGGCLTVDTLLVKKIEKIDIWVPSAFTPNKDGRNDVLRPTLIGLKDLRFFRIYNRWGQLLYETKNAQTGWDGIAKGLDQGTQTVIWVLEGVGLDGKTYTQKGTAVLIR